MEASAGEAASRRDAARVARAARADAGCDAVGRRSQAMINDTMARERGQ